MCVGVCVCRITCTGVTLKIYGSKIKHLVHPVSKVELLNWSQLTYWMLEFIMLCDNLMVSIMAVLEAGEFLGRSYTEHGI